MFTHIDTLTGAVFTNGEKVTGSISGATGIIQQETSVKIS